MGRDYARRSKDQPPAGWTGNGRRSRVVPEPPPPPSPKKRGRKPGHHDGRNPLNDTIRVARAYQRNPGWLRLTISPDIIERLTHLRDENTPWGKRPIAELRKQEALRVELVPFADHHMPAFMMRMEPHTFDPKGYKLFTDRYGHRFYVAVKAQTIKVKPDIEPKKLDIWWADDLGGIVVQMPDNDMLYEGPKNDMGQIMGEYRLVRNVRGTVRWEKIPREEREKG